jgi:phosphoenolpyruvate-protein kinase (PTS system EI component)
MDPQGYKVTLAQIEIAQVSREIRRLRRAIKFTEQQLTALKGRLERELGTTHSVILDAQLLMLEDPLFFQQVERRITEHLVNAEWAIQQELSRLLNSYHQVSDGYLRQRMSDIEDVANRLVATLSGKRSKPHRLQVGTVLVAESIPASRLAELDIDHVAGFITTSGGWASHAAIIARSLAIPAVAGVDSLNERFIPHQRAIIDGSEGLIIVNPTDATLHHYRMLQERRKRSFHALVEQSRGPTYTQDQQEITLQANIDLVSELQAATRFGAQGIGLFRSKFINS